MALNTRILLTSVLTLSLMYSIATTQTASAACLLSYETASVSQQGDGVALVSAFGGSQGAGFSVNGRLGLSNKRSLRLRTGACERSSVFGGALEVGLKQQLLSTQKTGMVDLSLTLDANLFMGSDGEERGEALSLVGFVPSLLVSYPYQLTAERRGFVSVVLGSTLYFSDQNRRRSAFKVAPVAGISAGVDILAKRGAPQKPYVHIQDERDN